MDESVNLSLFVNNNPDSLVWKPITEEHEIKAYEQLILDTKTALISGTKTEKGLSLEKLMTFVYERFSCAKTRSNISQKDNQYDHIVEFIDGAIPTFIHSKIGLSLTGECKNHNKSISVREVADLSDLLGGKGQKIGIFASSKGFSCGKTIWEYAEGKRRKHFLLYDRAIIGFTVAELEKLLLPDMNFYTMLKQKYACLVDEIADDYSPCTKEKHYGKTLFDSASMLLQNNIIDASLLSEIKAKLVDKYGEFE